MAYFNDAPCRVSAELEKYLREQEERERFPVPFNEWDDALMHDIIGNERLRKPIQELLISLASIDAVKGSFGDDTLNKARAFDALLLELRALREACKAAYEDL